MKTVTIFKYPVYGADYEIIQALYRGIPLSYWADGHSTLAHAKFYGQESIDAMKQFARRLGFTHCQFIGWTSQKPKGGKL